MVLGGWISPGLGRIARERNRQLDQEGYTHEGDVGRSQQILAAASAYILYVASVEEGVIPTHEEVGWPWGYEFFKPEPLDHALEKAGALIAAAIDARIEERKEDGSS